MSHIGKVLRIASISAIALGLLLPAAQAAPRQVSASTPARASIIDTGSCPNVQLIGLIDTGSCPEAHRTSLAGGSFLDTDAEI